MINDFQFVLAQRERDTITIWLNHPERLNVLSLQLMEELTAAFNIAGTSDATGVVLAAKGRLFSAGHDFAEMAQQSVASVEHLFGVCTNLMTTIQSIPQLVVASVHALATGAGCQLVATADVAVAAEEATFLTRYASEVTVVHRREEFRAQPLLVERAHQNGKVDFLLDRVVEEISGEDGHVSGVRLRHLPSGELETLPVGGVFIFVGFLPNTGLLAVHADHDENGYYLTDANMMTSVRGIYAAGDVRSQLTRQVTTAVGDATTAAIAATKQVEEERAQRHRPVPVAVGGT